MRRVKKTTSNSSAFSMTASIVNGRAMRRTIRHAAACLLLSGVTPLLAGQATSNGRRLSIGAGQLLVLTDPDLARIVIYDLKGETPRKLVAFGEQGIKPGQLE